MHGSVIRKTRNSYDEVMTNIHDVMTHNQNK